MGENKKFVSGVREAPKILIRVDATEKVALGHFKRCVSLAVNLREKGLSVSFLSAVEGPVEKLLSKEGFNLARAEMPLYSQKDCDKTLEYAEETGADVVIIDSYEFKNSHRKKLMDKGLFVVSITDSLKMDVVSQVIINSNLNSEKNNYSRSAGTDIFLGIKYLMLGRDFRDIGGRQNNLESVTDVLVTMGGVDHFDLTTRILSLLDTFKQDFTVTVIAGPYYDNLDRIKSQIGKMMKRVDLINAPETLSPYMKNCSIAFSAGGQTLYELALLGRPTIGITLWENQAGNVAELSKMGAILGIVYSKGREFENFLSAYTGRLIEDADLRKQLSDVSSKIVDGKGTERVCSALLDSYRTWLSKNIQNGGQG